MECEIITTDEATGSDLKRVACQCAVEMGFALDCEVQALTDKREADRLTLRLRAAEAIDMDAGFCLACRLACFCPAARVSILIDSADQFAAHREPRSWRALP